MRSDPAKIDQFMNDKSYTFENLESEYPDDVAHAKHKYKWEK